ncbi:DHA2 family efflux MFS transporter permease subunit [Methylovirgula sp. 4M-Z18]|uniref:DHA2 family efflux MFS transporter permease subunit n=1 Tax=Methylovirgula sp. 4M-Z18 TaxID=2293567 RepID=UPI000E2F9B6F|nr:DHA2 family efflux MFS transporter permease subunit [Methylovirgula sp. 4M-Z18]RFB80648.1 DHA2 family efflux MFS transporter permease subunit [Methylovirgula sp. 4M-Z18]
MSQTLVDAAPRSVGSNFRITALIIATAMFMEQLDSTVLATALPTMASSFGVSAAHMSIALTSYLLSLAVLIPASGRAADRYGSRTVFSISIVIFMLGSLFCAQAGSLSALVAARLLQGAGGAMMVPVGRLVLLRTVEKKDLVSAMGWLLVPALIGPIVGPPVGGFIVSNFNWRWIFYINLPISLLGLALTQVFIPNLSEDSKERFDMAGFVLSGISLAALLFGFEMTSRGTAEEAPIAIVCIVAGLVSGAAYIVHARRSREIEPILDLSLMRIKSFRISVIAGSLSRITQGAQPFLLPLMMQIGFGMSAAQSGLLTFATACGSILMKVAAKPILHRYGFRNTLLWNSVFSSLLYAACATFRPNWPHWAIFAVLLVCGFSMSLQFTAYNTVAYDDVPADRTSSANSFYTTFQQLMLSFGICAGSLMLMLARTVNHDVHSTPADFSAAFIGVTGISILAAPVCALLSPATGVAMSGYKANREAEAAT